MVLTELTPPGAAAAADAGGSATAGKQQPWAVILADYARPTVARSSLDLLTSLVPYLGLSVAMYFSLSVSYLLTLLIAIPTAGFLLRTYIVFHDCTHSSFLPSRRANVWLGCVLGVLVFAPFQNWQHNHAAHHATAADLDRRGHGDVPTLTVDEYYARDFRGRLGYRLYRNPVVMFGLGPLFAMILAPRIMPKDARAHIRRSVHLTNLALLVLIGGLCLLIGWRDYLLVQMPTALLAGAAGIWLFYVQHQFEDTYWSRADEWSYSDAALQGSSYLRLPKLLQFFTGNIGLHHVHHLSARIPNYNLQRAHDDFPVFQNVPVLTLWGGLRSVRLKLWDEESGRLVGFREAKASAASRRLSTDPSAAAAAA
jgi:omega-6 fatty acid desaturase (delta-12 desaturase)